MQRAELLLVCGVYVLKMVEVELLNYTMKAWEEEEEGWMGVEIKGVVVEI
jgi:hypothetical protein